MENETAAEVNAYIMRKCARQIHMWAYAPRGADCRFRGPSAFSRWRASLAHVEVAPLWVVNDMVEPAGVDFSGNGSGSAIRWEPLLHSARTIAARSSHTIDAG